MWDLYLYLVVGAQTPPLDDEMSQMTLPPSKRRPPALDVTRGLFANLRVRPQILTHLTGEGAIHYTDWITLDLGAEYSVRKQEPDALAWPGRCLLPLAGQIFGLCGVRLTAVLLYLLTDPVRRSLWTIRRVRNVSPPNRRPSLDVLHAAYQSHCPWACECEIHWQRGQAKHFAAQSSMLTTPDDAPSRHVPLCPSSQSPGAPQVREHVPLLIPPQLPAYGSLSNRASAAPRRAPSACCARTPKATIAKSRARAHAWRIVTSNASGSCVVSASASATAALSRISYGTLTVSTTEYCITCACLVIVACMWATRADGCEGTSGLHAPRGDAAPIDEDARILPPRAPMPRPLPRLPLMEEDRNATEQHGVDNGLSRDSVARRLQAKLAIPVRPRDCIPAGLRRRPQRRVIRTRHRHREGFSRIQGRRWRRGVQPEATIDAVSAVAILGRRGSSNTQPAVPHATDLVAVEAMEATERIRGGTAGPLQSGAQGANCPRPVRHSKGTHNEHITSVGRAPWRL